MLVRDIGICDDESKWHKAVSETCQKYLAEKNISFEIFSKLFYELMHPSSDMHFKLSLLLSLDDFLDEEVFSLLWSLRFYII